MSSKPIILYLALFLLSALLTWTYRSSFHPAPSPLPSSHPKLAFATFLAANANPSADPSQLNDNEDGYFLGARVLTYQLLHSPVTGTNLSIPFVVLATPDVAPRKIARLRADGASVRVVPRVQNGWIKAADPRWRDVMTKLRLWEMVEYEKVCFVDADTLVTRRLDEVFWDEGTVLRHTRPEGKGSPGKEGRGDGDGARPPGNYMFAAHIDSWGYEHAWPPEESEYFNVGFFCFRPDREVFEYYQRLAGMEGRFDPSMPEQNLLNYAHRRNGPMPWARLWEGWNVNWPTEKDYRRGVGSFHAKYWDGDPSHDRVLKAIWREQRAEMEGYWRGREAREWRLGGMIGAGL
ncbi:Hypothetical protein D9617_2g052170 [Elsinoe fawcettii]|nr:Hypothetical protein D9617_2g052170 [Elsinoe fawcettii]